MQVTDKVKEALSAIMDGEASDIETRRVLDEIARDDDLRETWNRFHVARGAMADEPVDRTDAAEATRRLWKAVDAGVGEESTTTLEREPRRRLFGLRTAAAGLGVAAATVLAVWLYPVQHPGGVRQPADPVARVDPPASLVQHAAWETLSAEDRARAHAYMLQHLRRQSMVNRAHPIPIAKLATYRPQPRPGAMSNDAMIRDAMINEMINE